MEARDFVNALVAHGLTQAAIASRTGIPQPTISKVARGDVADVLSKNYRKLQQLHAEVILGAPICATIRPPCGVAQPQEAGHAG